LPVLFCIGFVVLWYFAGFWIALGLTLFGIVAVYKPDLIFAAIGLGLLYVCVLVLLG